MEVFGTAPDGRAVHRVWLARAGSRAAIITWGASLQDFRIAGVDRSLVLGSDDFAAYLGPLRHAGAIAGPVANRIAGGQAMLDGEVLRFDRNENGITTLHGGASGTSVNLWQIEEVSDRFCRFSFRVPDGQGGLPGSLWLKVTYMLDEDGALRVEMQAQTERRTFCNLAHHAYWTLNGGRDVSGHGLQIESDSYLPVDERKIPTDPAPVANTRFDFRQLRPVIRPGDAPLDHNFCLRPSHELRRVCTLTTEGLQLDIETTEPGLQVYDGGGLNSGAFATHHGRPYCAHSGIAIEPQHWPDAPNRADFPSIRLDPSETYRQTSRFHVARLPA